MAQIRALVAQLDLSRQELTRWKQELAEAARERDQAALQAEARVALAEAQAAEWKRRGIDAEALREELANEKKVCG